MHGGDVRSAKAPRSRCLRVQSRRHALTADMLESRVKDERLFDAALLGLPTAAARRSLVALVEQSRGRRGRRHGRAAAAAAAALLVEGRARRREEGCVATFATESGGENPRVVAGAAAGAAVTAMDSGREEGTVLAAAVAHRASADDRGQGGREVPWPV